MAVVPSSSKLVKQGKLSLIWPTVEVESKFLFMIPSSISIFITLHFGVVFNWADAIAEEVMKIMDRMMVLKFIVYLQNMDEEIGEHLHNANSRLNFVIFAW